MQKGGATGRCALAAPTGEEYEKGWFLPSNMEKALYWYRLAAVQGDFRATYHRKQLEAKWATAEAEIFAARKAAERGDSRAQLILGRAYFLGLGLHQSFKKAVPLLLSAAEQGRGEAMYWLSKLTQWEFLTHLAPGESDTWLRRAAEAGYAEAQWEFVLKTGGDEAHHWERLAAAQGHDKAKWRVHSYTLEDVHWHTETERTIKYAERYYATQDAYSNFGNWDNAVKCFDAGELYLAGEGVPQSDAEALKWYRKGVAMGDTLSAWRIGQFYEEGRGGLAQSYEEALKWYYCAFGELDYIMVDNVYDVTREDEENGGDYWGFPYPLLTENSVAAEWYRVRADAGDANAQWLTGLRYELGRGFEESTEKAAFYYSRSAEQNNVVGMCLLGRAYQYGFGVPRFGSLAWEWFILAQEQQLSDAESTLPNRLEEDYFI